MPFFYKLYSPLPIVELGSYGRRAAGWSGLARRRLLHSYSKASKGAEDYERQP
jgi:hypothetical protein